MNVEIHPCNENFEHYICVIDRIIDRNNYRYTNIETTLYRIDLNNCENEFS